jgi:peroxiredoxin
VVVGLFLIALLSGCEPGAQPVSVGQQFPGLEGQDLLTGKTITLEQFRGKVVLIDFWATWCPPCIAEIPTVKRAYDKYHKLGFEIISISLDHDREDCERFVKREKMNWHHVFDGGGRLAARYGVSAIPAMYLVGKDGNVVSDNARGRRLEAAIKEALLKVPE